MAIRGGFTTKSLVRLPEAYMTVPVITLRNTTICGILQFQGSMEVLVYQDKESFNLGADTVDRFTIDFDLDKDATISWAIMLLKNHERVSNAEDCE